jgi:hypothetical protein
MVPWYRILMKSGVLCAVIVFLFACGGSKKNNEYMDQFRAYNDGIRWRAPGTAAAHIPVGERADFLEERADIDEDLRIADYEILRVGMNRDLDKATLSVEYQWHLDSRGIVYKTVTRQSWERNDDQWIMVEEKRVRGEPMPGVPEPESEPDA